MPPTRRKGRRRPLAPRRRPPAAGLAGRGDAFADLCSATAGATDALGEGDGGGDGEGDGGGDGGGDGEDAMAVAMRWPAMRPATRSPVPRTRPML
jgi:hypothetical protein